MPFITEEIYQKYFKKDEKIKSIHINEWPEEEKIKQKELDELFKFRHFVGILEQVRKWKSSNQKPMNSEIILTLLKEEISPLGDSLIEDLKAVTNAKEIKEGKQFRVEFVD